MPSPAFAQTPPPAAVAACDNAALVAAQQAHANETPVTLCGSVTGLEAPRRNAAGELHRYFNADIGNGNAFRIDVALDAMNAPPPLADGEHVVIHGWYYYFVDKAGIAHEGVHWTHHTAQGPHPGGYILIDGTTYD